MAFKTRPVVVSMGAVCPLAEGAVEGAMLLRVGLSSIGDTPRNDADGAPIMMGYLPTIPAEIEGEERVAVLARRALVECRDRFARRMTKKHPMRVGIAALTSPGKRMAGVSAPVDLALTSEMRSFEAGPRSFGAWSERGTRDALAEGVSWLAAGQADVVFWGGAHSDWSTERLRALDDRGDLYRLESLDAVIPGEGAAFLALTTEAFASRIGVTPLATVEGAGSISLRVQADANQALGGFAGALRSAMGADPVVAGWVLSDLTFEASRLAEWEAMLVRAHDLLGRPYLIDNPCRRIGALGAAAIPTFAAFFVASWASRMQASRSAVALDSTEEGTRSAVWLTNLCPPPTVMPASG